MEELIRRYIEQMRLRKMFPEEMSSWWDEMEICHIEKEVTEYLEEHPEVKYDADIIRLIRHMAREKGTLHLLEEVTEKLL